MPCVFVRPRGLTDAQNLVGGAFDSFKELMGLLENTRLLCGIRSDSEIEAIYGLPQRSGQRFSNGSRIFAGGCQAADHGIQIAAIKEQIIDDVFACGGSVTLQKCLGITAGMQQR